LCSEGGCEFGGVAGMAVGSEGCVDGDFVFGSVGSGCDDCAGGGFCFFVAGVGGELVGWRSGEVVFVYAIMVVVRCRLLGCCEGGETS